MLCGSTDLLETDNPSTITVGSNWIQFLWMFPSTILKLQKLCKSRISKCTNMNGKYRYLPRFHGSTNILNAHNLKQKVNQYGSLDMQIFDSLIFKRKNRNKNHTRTNCADPWIHVDLGFTYPRIHRCLERGSRS